MLYFSSKLYYGTWLFYFINILKIDAFSSIFSQAGSMIGGLVISLEFQEVRHQPFSMAQPLQHSSIMGKIQHNVNTP